MMLVIKDIIGRDTALTTDDGDVVFEKIVDVIESGKPIELDFSGINIMTTAFLSAQSVSYTSLFPMNS